MLHIKNLCVSVGSIAVVNNLSLDITSGTTHAIMGPNGSGKSSLALAIAGHPHYAAMSGSITFNGVVLDELSADKRARLGIYLTLQQPPSIAGLSVFTLIKEAWRAHHNAQPDLAELQTKALEYFRLLGLPDSFLYRNVHEGFSGGEKKRFEIVVALVVKPKLIILDEIDSGLDVDALRLVANAIAYAKSDNPALCVLLITHYQRILNYIQPDHVHILLEGQFVSSGTFELVKHIEQRGYNAFRKAQSQ